MKPALCTVYCLWAACWAPIAKADSAESGFGQANPGSGQSSVVLWSNGAYVNGSNLQGVQLSILESGYDALGMTAAGYRTGANIPQRVADNFTITSGAWVPGVLKVYAYQSNNLNPFTAAYVGIFDADPTLDPTLSPRWGDLSNDISNNRLISQRDTGAYRAATSTSTIGSSGTRRITEVTIDLAGILGGSGGSGGGKLEPGEYWIAWGLRGSSDSAVVASVPVVPTVKTHDGLTWGRGRGYPGVGVEQFWQFADGNITQSASGVNDFETYDLAFSIEGTAATVTNAWQGASGAAYATAANWTGGTVPSGSGAAALFSSTSASTSTVVLDSSVVLGKITFTGGASFSVSDGGNNTAILLQADTSSGFGGVQVNALSGGTQTIAVPVSAVSAVSVRVDNAAGGGGAARLDFAQGLLADGNAVHKRGPGVWGVRGITAGRLMVFEGTVEILPKVGTAAATSVVSELRLLGESKLELHDNDLLINYTGTSPLAQVRAWQTTGRITAGELLDGFPAVLVIIEASDYGLTSFNGQQVDETAVIGQLTYQGDANIDGRVDAFDYSIIDDNFGRAGTFLTGDLNADGFVSAFDYASIDDAFGAGPPLSPLPSFTSANTEVFIPEPAGVGVLVLAAGVMVRRKRG